MGSVSCKVGTGSNAMFPFCLITVSHLCEHAAVLWKLFMESPMWPSNARALRQQREEWDNLQAKWAQEASDATGPHGNYAKDVHGKWQKQS